jgi:hypothetical protein
LLNESARDPRLFGVHERLLVRWVGNVFAGGRTGAAGAAANDQKAEQVGDGADAKQDVHPAGVMEGSDPAAVDRLGALRKMGRVWRPTGTVWRTVLDRCSRGEGDDQDGRYRLLVVAEAAAEAWRAIEPAEATLAWATWLLRHGQGARAAGVIGAVRDEHDRATVEAGWTEVLRTGTVTSC